ncbi:hypothetical protein SEA_MRWORLDWIDE_8 [Microbacterium phage MrWorldwide]|nr:hypothetical protein PBI_LUDGATE_8 [Microbacterium phage Ludgate]AVJ51205.1 hypothetical protein SEA_PUPPYEGGO_8 [Microbacterium phage PuppyEggo]AVR56337.1 hypothetical protein PBI_NAGEM_8 [Microbacterium phage Nagem]AVR56425.1 hypothetical protein PBI_RAPTOR_8 [Microbacterium phage Raptor]QCG78210.1 hypothetical protein SEA_GREYS_8 [Microbacterium phage Greys]QDH47762.1 hypothetical protein SEA_SHEE_8 [Microbacterium phage Shee]QDM56932.1 hypothetical protein SEA_BONESMCCOY_8 [Microbacter
MACTDCDDKQQEPFSETEGEGTVDTQETPSEVYDHAEHFGPPEA